MLDMRRRGFIMLLGGPPGGHETGQREAKTKVPPNASPLFAGSPSWAMLVIRSPHWR
jgi:hypothetical protein